jgi:hypothetical protein
VISGHIVEFVRKAFRGDRLDSAGPDAFSAGRRLPVFKGRHSALRHAAYPLASARAGSSTLIKRYFMVLGAILVVVIGGLYATKPKAGAMKRGVDEAMTAYAEAQAAAPPGMLRDISLPQVVEEHDWILARSYSAEQDSKSFSCWGISIVTVCDTPE